MLILTHPSFLSLSLFIYLFILACDMFLDVVTTSLLCLRLPPKGVLENVIDDVLYTVFIGSVTSVVGKIQRRHASNTTI